MTPDHWMTSGITGLEEVAHDILSLRTRFVNVVFVGEKEGRHWVLIDTGMTGFAEHIIEVAERRFAGPPTAIVLTHGHFDQVGTVIELEQYWGVPVYAHKLELPYLTGMKDYQFADHVSVDGSLSRLSSPYTNEAINLDDRVFSLPEDNTVPGAPGWRWVHTPGHTPGHISLFRETDRCLIAGDAIVTAKGEALLNTLLQNGQREGESTRFETDWAASVHSLENLRQLEPSIVMTGRGHSLRGEALVNSLKWLD